MRTGEHDASLRTFLIFCMSCRSCDFTVDCKELKIQGGFINMDVSSIFASSRLNRRTFLKTAGAAAGAATLAACGSPGSSGSGSTVTLQYWDYYVSQAPYYRS